MAGKNKDEFTKKTNYETSKPDMGGFFAPPEDMENLDILDSSLLEGVDEPKLTSDLTSLLLDQYEYVEYTPQPAKRAFSDVSHHMQYIEQFIKNGQGLKNEQDATWSDFDTMGLDFKECRLAQSDPLNDDGSEVVLTFKGFLEVAKPFGVVRLNEFDSTKECPYTEFPETMISQYRLKNGDEIMCTYKTENTGRRVTQKLLSVNGILVQDWDVLRPDYQALKDKSASSKVACEGQWLGEVCAEVGLFKGDNVFIYFSERTNVKDSVNKIMEELISGFDKVVYINSNYNPIRNECPEHLKFIKFTTKFTETLNNQRRMSLIAINYAKRMAEMGKNVAVVVDDLAGLALLDKNTDDMTISKSILASARNTDKGSITIFSVIPMRNKKVSNFEVQDRFKYVENLTIVIDGTELDTKNTIRS